MGIVLIQRTSVPISDETRCLAQSCFARRIRYAEVQRPAEGFGGAWWAWIQQRTILLEPSYGEEECQFIQLSLSRLACLIAATLQTYFVTQLHPWNCRKLLNSLTRDSRPRWKIRQHGYSLDCRHLEQFIQSPLHLHGGAKYAVALGVLANDKKLHRFFAFEEILRKWATGWSQSSAEKSVAKVKHGLGNKQWNKRVSNISHLHKPRSSKRIEA